MKLIRSILPVISALCLCAPFANAQSVDAYFGVGTMTDSSSKTSIDTFGTGNPFTSPRLGGTFGKAGADVMLTPHFGVNGDVDFRFAQGAYSGLTYRPMFYDFNAIWAPTGRSLKRVVPEIQAGLGAVNLKFFSPSASFCDAFAGCSSSNSYLESSNHFQVHLAAGLRLYATQHLFFQPQVDAHYVNNLFQFGSNWVPEYSASVGWSFGER
ncbi:MAG: outer membrane beta-barrel protein [Acidobacteriaceae bacterium]|nr:outer membrane beta-barrel protein [Acidobacteriaceae bacterium]